MEPRNLLALAIAFCFLSALVGLAALFYLYVWAPPSSVATSADKSSTSPTVVPSALIPLPSLVTPTSTRIPPPTPTPSATPLPTHTPTPSPTPSPTPVPAARLANAHQAKRNGDYRRARSEFRTVLDDPGTDHEAVEALYELGVCTFLDGEQAAARELLEQFVAQHPQDPRVAAAHYYLAEVLTGLEDHSAAIVHYQAYLDIHDVLSDLIYTRIGDSFVVLQDYAAAISAYEQALEHAPDLGQQFDLEEQIGVTLSAWGQYDKAIERLKGITERSQNVYRLARIWYLIGQAYRMAGREAEALDAFSHAVYGDPQPGYAHAALIVLVEAGVKVEEFQRGMIDYYAGSYGAAVAAFYHYMESTSDYSSDAHYYAALSYLNAESFDLAVQECERALARYPNTIPHWGELWLIRAQAFAGQDRSDDAVKAYAEFADGNPDHPLAPQARWEAAQLLENEGHFDAAAGMYTLLADRHVNADRAPMARFRSGLCRYRDGDPDAASIAWRELIDGYPASEEALRGRYWLGKVLWAQGADQEARSLLQYLAEQHPRDYYGLRAARLLASNGRPSGWLASPVGIHLTGDEETGRQEAEAWLRTWADLSEDTDLNVIPPEMANDARLRRGTELLMLGELERARDEFEALRQDVVQDPAALYRIALLTRDLGLYAPSLRATIDLITIAPENSILEMPRMIQRLAFPVYFSDLIIAESTAYGVDPLLMFALIRQESVFDAQVTSWAGAVGLSQIMPATGAWIAELMPWPEYREDDLQRAYLNAKFGVWFMSRILEMTDGNIAAALAGYNGGPGNGISWQEASGGDLDLLVEVINRDEPQRYVREIYRHYDVYARLYGAPSR